jgi:DNA-binding NarL/FixJ family response regulator
LRAGASRPERIVCEQFYTDRIVLALISFLNNGESMNAFRILVVDDHPIFRLGLCSLLRSHEGWEVCGEAGDGRDAVEKCMQLKPDLVILDICLPKLNGVDAARQIMKDNPAQRILVLTDAGSDKVVSDCLQAGVRGWVLKSDAPIDLTAAVEAMQRNNCVYSLRISDLLVGSLSKQRPTGPAAPRVPLLSPREREVLQLLAEGRTSKDVAVILNIAVKTAETHRSNIMLKLDIHSIAKLVLYAVRNEIIHVQSTGAASPSERGNGTANVTLQSVN